MEEVRFLIVDNSHTVISLVRKSIQYRFGAYHILEAADGAEALGILESNNIDIVLSSWELPNISGEELLYRIRNHNKFMDIPFILMTSNVKKDFIEHVFKKGVTGHLIKPFSAKALEDKIRESLNGANKRQTRRYANLPKHQLTVKVKGKSFPTEVVNISMAGVLIEMVNNEELKLFTTCELRLEVEKIRKLVINPLVGTVIRLTADLSYPSARLCKVAIYFSDSIMNREVKKSLKSFLEFLDSLSPDVIGGNELYSCQ